MERGVVFYLIAHPVIASRTQNALSVLKTAGIENAIVLRGTRATGGEISSQQHAIALSHYRCLVDFSRPRRHARLKPDVVVLEDDVTFNVQNASEFVQHVASLLHHHHPRWKTCHLGHIPMGPVLPLSHMFCLTSLPFSAQAILWRGEFACDLTSRVSAQRFQRPHYMEAMLDISFFQKFALNTPIAFQSQRPKELRKFDETVPVFGSISSTCGFNALSTTFVVFALVLTLYCVCVMPTLIMKRRWKSIALFLVWMPLCMSVFAMSADAIGTITSQT
tara:strand:- start:11034 stop:11864 length:831 start_codon:yes stop_codon:yes gene_type:complete